MAVVIDDQRMRVAWAVSFYWLVSIALVFLNKESMNRVGSLRVLATPLCWRFMFLYSLMRPYSSHGRS